MENISLASQLRRLRFAPQRGGIYAKPYPLDIRTESYWEERDSAKVLGFKQNDKALIKNLKSSMSEDGFNELSIENHPSMISLKRYLHLSPRVEIKNKHHIFTHYDRIGWSHRAYHKRDQALTGLSHIRHVAIIPNKMKCERLTAWANFVVYQLQLLDSWSQEVVNIFDAIHERALDHIQQIGSAGLYAYDEVNGEYDEPPWYPVPIAVSIQYRKYSPELQDLAGQIAAKLSLYTDSDDEKWWRLNDNGAEIINVSITPISSDDEEQIDDLAIKGGESLKRKTEPKADPCEKHILVEVTDKHLVLLYGQTEEEKKIGHVNYGHTGDPVKWRVILDEGTRMLYVEPIFSDEDYSDIRGFLDRAWSHKPNLIFEGLPKSLEIAKSKMNLFPGLTDYLDEHDVKLTHPEKGLGLGITTGRNWLGDSRTAVNSKTGFTNTAKLKKWSADHQLIISALGWYGHPDGKLCNYKALWDLGYAGMNHYSGIKVDTKSFVSIIGRKDVEAFFRNNRPSVD
jgi:hypothetical protein